MLILGAWGSDLEKFRRRTRIVLGSKSLFMCFVSRGVSFSLLEKDAHKQTPRKSHDDLRRIVDMSSCLFLRPEVNH